MFCFIVNDLLDSQNDHSLSPCVLLSSGPLDFQGVPSPSPLLYKNDVSPIFSKMMRYQMKEPRFLKMILPEILGEMLSRKG